MNKTIIAPPRSGGTTELIRGNRNSFTYLNYRHTSIQHALKVFGNFKEYEITDDDKIKPIVHDIVYISGRNRIRHNPPQAPHNGHLVCDPFTANLLEKMYNIDGYHTLVKLIEEFNSTFTVPHVAVKDIKPNGVLLIDEEPTIDFFRPKSKCLLVISWELGIFSRDNLVEKLIQKIPSSIESKYPEFVNWLNELNKKLIELSREWDKATNNKKDVLVSGLKSLPKPPYVDLPEDEKDKIVVELISRGWLIDEYEVVKLFIASLFFKDYYLRSKKTKHEIYLIADESKLLLKEWLNKWEKIDIRINNPDLAEWFYRSLGRNYVIKQLEFPYLNNFIIVETDIKELAVLLNKEGIPFLVLTATKEEAEKAKKWFKSNGIDIEIVDEHTTLSQIAEWIQLGRNLVFYQNSTISRGIDLPFYDIMLVWSTGFACPYEEWLSEQLNDNSVLVKKLTQETEQCIMRIAPVKGFKENSPKFVAFSTEPNLNILKPRFMGKASPSYLIELKILFCWKIKKHIEKPDILKTETGEPLSFYSKSIYYRITIKLTVPENQDFVFLRFIINENPKITKTIVQNSVKPQDIRALLSGLASGVTRFIKLEELHNMLRDLGVSDVVLRQYIIGVLQDVGILRREGGIWVLDLPTGFGLVGCEPTKEYALP